MITSCFTGHEDICSRPSLNRYTGDKDAGDAAHSMGFILHYWMDLEDERRADDLRDVSFFWTECWRQMHNCGDFICPDQCPHNIVYVAQTSVVLYMHVPGNPGTDGTYKKNTENAVPFMTENAGEG